MAPHMIGISQLVEPKVKDSDVQRQHIKTYDEAICLTGNGKFHILILVCCGLCLISFVMESLSNGYIISSAQCDFQMTSTEKGLLTSIVYAGMIVSAHMWGYLADTKGRRKVLIVALIMDIVCSLIASIVPTYELFVTLRFFNGIFISCPSSVAFVYLGEFHSEKNRTSSMVWLCAFFSIGTTSLPALAWAVIPQSWSFALPWCTFNSWRIFVLLVTIPAFITTLALWLLVPESPKYLLAAGCEKESLAVLQRVYSLNSGKAKDDFPVSGLKLGSGNVHGTESLSPVAVMKHMWEQTKPIFIPPHLICTLLAFSIQFGLYASTNGMILWMPEIFNKITEYQTTFPQESVTICKAFGGLQDVSPIPLPAENAHYNFSKDVQTINEISLFQDITEEYYLPNKNSSGNYTNNRQETPENCQPNLSFQSFINTLIIGPSSGLAFILVGYIVKVVKKKIILIMCLMGGGCCGIALYFATSTAELMVLPAVFFAFPTMCISVINSIVVDAFPTRLRAMALGLSLMVGRIGTICSSFLLGILLESNCIVAFILLNGVIFIGALLAIFLPEGKAEV